MVRRESNEGFLPFLRLVYRAQRLDLDRLGNGPVKYQVHRSKKQLLLPRPELLRQEAKHPRAALERVQHLCRSSQQLNPLQPQTSVFERHGSLPATTKPARRRIQRTHKNKSNKRRPGGHSQDIFLSDGRIGYNQTPASLSKENKNMLQLKSDKLCRIIKLYFFDNYNKDSHTLQII